MQIPASLLPPTMGGTGQQQPSQFPSLPSSPSIGNVAGAAGAAGTPYSRGPSAAPMTGMAGMPGITGTAPALRTSPPGYACLSSGMGMEALCASRGRYPTGRDFNDPRWTCPFSWTCGPDPNNPKIAKLGKNVTCVRAIECQDMDGKIGSLCDQVRGLPMRLFICKGAKPVQVGCGNGKLEPELGEECDDRNNASGDTCTADCKKGGLLLNLSLQKITCVHKCASGNAPPAGYEFVADPIKESCGMGAVCIQAVTSLTGATGATTQAAGGAEAMTGTGTTSSATTTATTSSATTTAAATSSTTLAPSATATITATSSALPSAAGTQTSASTSATGGQVSCITNVSGGVTGMVGGGSQTMSGSAECQSTAGEEERESIFEKWLGVKTAFAATNQRRYQPEGKKWLYNPDIIEGRVNSDGNLEYRCKDDGVSPVIFNVQAGGKAFTVASTITCGELPQAQDQFMASASVDPEMMQRMIQEMNQTLTVGVNQAMLQMAPPQAAPVPEWFPQSAMPQPLQQMPGQLASAGAIPGQPALPSDVPQVTGALPGQVALPPDMLQASGQIPGQLAAEGGIPGQPVAAANIPSAMEIERVAAVLGRPDMQKLMEKIQNTPPGELPELLEGSPIAKNLLLFLEKPKTQEVLQVILPPSALPVSAAGPSPLGQLPLQSVAMVSMVQLVQIAEIPQQQIQQAAQQAVVVAIAAAETQAAVQTQQTQPTQSVAEGQTAPTPTTQAGVPIAATCGDKTVQASEQCDDGNLLDGDGCSKSCTTEKFCLDDTVCNDGSACTNDICNKTSFRCQNTAKPCPSGQTCRASDGQCVAATAGCGNKVLEPNLLEECDDGNKVGGDGCSASCKSEVLQVCGNGNIEKPEACDDGNTQSGDGCSSECKVESIAPECGNKIIEAGEKCDPPGTAGGCTAGQKCSSACAACVVACGDGIEDSGEKCGEPGLSCPVGIVCQSCVCTGGKCGDGYLDKAGDYGELENCEKNSDCLAGKECSSCKCVTPTPVCGNKKIEGAEQCDDGNAIDCDECNSNCQNPIFDNTPTATGTCVVKCTTGGAPATTTDTCKKPTQTATTGSSSTAANYDLVSGKCVPVSCTSAECGTGNCPSNLEA